MRIYRLLVFAAAMLLTAACGAPASKADTGDKKKEETAVAAEGEEIVEEITMTGKEKELLAAVYPNEDMIKDGQLFGYEEETLREIRAGETYMKEKYPEESFEIVSIEPANKFYPWTTLHMESPEYGAFKTVVTPENGEYRYSEDFYGLLLRKTYDEKISQILGEGGITAAAYTDFYSPMGEEAGRDTTPEELIALKSGLPRDTHLFVEDTGDKDETAGKAADILRSAGVYGSYTLYFVPDALEEDAAVLEDARQAFVSRTFNCFDVK